MPSRRSGTWAANQAVSAQVGSPGRGGWSSSSRGVRTLILRGRRGEWARVDGASAVVYQPVGCRRPARSAILAPMSGTDAPPATSATDVRDWLARALGGEVTRWEQLVSGNSRTTWLADVATPGGEVAAVVRSDAGDGPFSGTELTLGREARLYAALADTGVRLPRLLAHDDERDVLAVTRAEGETAWSPEVLDDLLAELARLHSVDAEALDLPGFARSSLGDLELWARIARE